MEEKLTRSLTDSLQKSVGDSLEEKLMKSLTDSLKKSVGELLEAKLTKSLTNSLKTVEIASQSNKYQPSCHVHGLLAHFQELYKRVFQPLMSWDQLRFGVWMYSQTPNEMRTVR